MKNCKIIVLGLLLVSFVFSVRLPIVGGDVDNWGYILNEYLNYLAGPNATELVNTMVPGKNIYPEAINSTHIKNHSINGIDINPNTNITAYILNASYGIILGGELLTAWNEIKAKLSNLIIDVNKDWNNKSIYNVSSLRINRNLYVNSHISNDWTLVVEGEPHFRDFHGDELFDIIGNVSDNTWRILMGDIEEVLSGTLFSIRDSIFSFLNGRVGIKTNNPSYDLDVNGTTNTKSLRFVPLSNHLNREDEFYYHSGYKRYFIKRGKTYIPLEWEHIFINGEYLNHTVYLFSSHFFNNYHLYSLTENGARAINHGATLIPAILERAKTNTLNFDGNNDYLELIDQNPNWEDGITIIGIVKWDSFNKWSRIIDFGRGAAADNILIANNQTNGDFVYEVYYDSESGGKVVIPNAITTRRWLAFVVIERGGTPGSTSSVTIRILRRDGRVYKTVGTTFVPKQIHREYWVGRSHWSADKYFNGNMAFLGVWNTALDINIASYIAAQLLNFYAITY